MQIRLPGHLARDYKSASQQARVVTEAWGCDNFYCLNCPSPRLEPTPRGTEAIDYRCPRCDSPYQLKGQSRPLGGRINDAAYDAMLRAIRSANTPNLLALQYDRSEWLVRNLILIPHFVFTQSAIQKRKALSASARRHGHILCNIVLANLPQQARVPLIVEGVALKPRAARELYNKLRPLERVRLEARGWTLDVLNAVQKLGKQDFTLAEAYGFAEELGRLHPRNRHVEPKIRQQLQRLRDFGFLQFLSPGNYRLKS